MAGLFTAFKLQIHLFQGIIQQIDAASRDILLAKLKHYGIRGPAQSLIQSFLKRQHFVCVNGTNSPLKAIPYRGQH